MFKTNHAVSKHIIKTLIIKYGIYANMFAEKMWVAFAYTCELDIVLARTVNILTTYELIKLKMLWTTGPWALNKRGIQISFSCFSMKTKNMQKV